METINKRAKDIADAAARNGLTLIGLLGFQVKLHAALRVVPAALSLIESELLEAPCDPAVFDSLICILERACDTARQVLQEADREAWSQSEAIWRLSYGPKMVELMDLLRATRDELKEATGLKARIIQACEAIESLGKASTSAQREAVDLTRIAVSGHFDAGRKMKLLLRGGRGSGRSHCLALCVAEALRAGAKRIEVIGSLNAGVGEKLRQALGPPINSAGRSMWLDGVIRFLSWSVTLAGHEPDLFICDNAERVGWRENIQALESPRVHTVMVLPIGYEVSLDVWQAVDAPAVTLP